MGVLVSAGSYAVPGGYCVPDSGQQVPTSGTSLNIRSRGSDPANKPGVPLFKSIGSFGHSVAHIPYGATITATGPSKQGADNKGNTTWWPVTYQGVSGWLSGWDITGTGGGSSVTSNASALTGNTASNFLAGGNS